MAKLFSSLPNKTQASDIMLSNGDTLDTMMRKQHAFDINVSNKTSDRNFIYSGLAIRGDLLNAIIETGEFNLDGINYTLDSETSIALQARSASLIYISKGLTPTIGVAQAELPAIDAYDVLRYDFRNWDGTSAVPNSAVGVNGNTLAVTNPIVLTNPTPGTSLKKVDGYVGYAIQGDGSTGFGVSTSSTGFPSGNTERELEFLLTVGNITTTRGICGMGGSGAAFLFRIANARVTLVGGTTHDTGFDVEAGKTYMCSIGYDGYNFILRIGGQQVYSVTTNPGTSLTTLKVLCDYDQSGKSSDTLHFINFRTKLRSLEQCARMCNRLFIPLAYSQIYQEEYIDGVKMYDISTAENTISSAPFNNTLLPSFAFNKDGNTSTFASLQQYTAVSGAAWIGQQRVKSKIKHIRLTTWTNTTSAISSAKIQYSVDNMATWNDIQTSALASTASTDNEIDIVDYPVTGEHCIRVLANSGVTGSGTSWYVPELKMFTDVKPSTVSNMFDNVPDKSIILGLATTTSTKAKVRVEYKYGRRDGSPKGNNKVFLGWRRFTSSTGYVDWDNPFDTDRVSTEYVVAQDAMGTNEIDAWDRFQTGSSNDYGITRLPTVSKKIRVQIMSSGLTNFNGLVVTSGFIGCYAEVRL